MLICIAQTKSETGKIQENINNHLRIADTAIDAKADLLVFPELSITNYETKLASQYALDIQSEIFNPFQKLSDGNNINIAIGAPKQSDDGLSISMFIFSPNNERRVYSKQILHEDEFPYFVCGKEQVILNIKDKKIALGICYETLQREHFLNAFNKGVDIYVASVAKSKSGVAKAHEHFANMSREFKTPILMSNCIGVCDNVMSAGQSATWNNSGQLIDKLDDNNQGMLIFNTETEQTHLMQISDK